MSIRIDDVISVHRHALTVATQRSEILSANLAHQDTPGFQARDLDFAAEMRRLEAGEAGRPKLLYRVPSQPAQDGNTVELPVEQAEFARNAMQFQASLTFLSLQFRGLKQAIEGR